MTKKEIIEHWIQLSDNDLKVAEDLFVLKHYLYVGFMCHQSIEKIFKGYFVKINDDSPPFTHDLLIISTKGNFSDELPEDLRQFIRILSPLNIRLRYPEYKDLIFKQMTRDITWDILNKTKNLQQWIKEKL
jgi:HEPN domain-containing protein